MKKNIFFGLVVGIGLLVSCLNANDGPIIIREPTTFDEQLALDTVLIDSILALDDIVAEVHDSGIRYVIEAVGEGDSATLSDDVLVIYEGRFLNGQVFDGNAEGISFPLNGLIQAWQLTIPLIKEGGRITIYSPSGYCYGSAGTNTIPPNASLVFDIELLEVNPE